MLFKAIDGLQRECRRNKGKDGGWDNGDSEFLRMEGREYSLGAGN